MKIQLQSCLTPLVRVSVGAAYPYLNLGDINGYCVPITHFLKRKAMVGIVDEKLSAMDYLENELDQRLLKGENNKQSVFTSEVCGTLIINNNIAKDEPHEEAMWV